MTTELPYLHVLDGRLRIKVPEVKSAPIQALKLQQKLTTIAGIHTVTANAKTGNVLIFFDSTMIQPEHIVSFLREGGYFRASPAPSPQIGQRLTNLVLHSAVEATIERLVLALI